MYIMDSYIDFGEDSTITARASSNGPLEAEAWYNLLKFNGGNTPTYSHVAVSFADLALPFQNIATDIFYGRIWVTSEVDFGVIVEIREQEIEVWNADFYNETSITSFTDPGDLGISIDTVSTPVALTYNESVSYTVTVSPTGPSTQYTEYDWTVGGVDFTTLVIGTRTIAFPFPANWKNGVSLKYMYDTIIFSSKNDYEQRRDFRPGIEREERADLLLADNESMQFKHLMRNNLHRFFVVPIYPEVFFTASTLTNETTIIATEDLSYFWNLHNYCSNILIVDHLTGLSEVKELVSVAGTNVIVTQVINKIFNPASVSIYPAFIGVVASFNYSNITNTVIRANMFFKERVSAG